MLNTDQVLNAFNRFTKIGKAILKTDPELAKYPRRVAELMVSEWIESREKLQEDIANLKEVLTNLKDGEKAPKGAKLSLQMKEKSWIAGADLQPILEDMVQLLVKYAGGVEVVKKAA